LSKIGGREVDLLPKGFGHLMKQAQVFQNKLAEIQEELKQKQVEANSGGGMVKVVANGNGDIVEIKIDPEIVNPDDVELLEDLVLAAVNEAKRQAQALMATEMEKLTGGFCIPGLSL